jgi:formylglycine-generating enzyme required for sulfatase activity
MRQLTLLGLSLLVACSSDAPATPGASSNDGGTSAADGASSVNADAGGGGTTDAGSADAASAKDAGSDATSGSDSGADGGVLTMASCAVAGDGRTNCGAGSESCCASLTVTGGTYNRTYTNTGAGPTAEADPATVSTFRLDKYEVTVGRFRQFVAAWNGGAGWTPPAGSGKHTHLNSGKGLAATALGFEAGWQIADNASIAPTDMNLACEQGYETWTPAAGAHEKLPATCMNWYEAAAFCIWDGGFLPSEAEWEYAAAGGAEERQYAWGTTAPGTNNQYAIYGCYYPASSGTCSSVSNVASVGLASAGAGKYGQLDLLGNVSEYALDYYATPYTTCTDCTNATVAVNRVARGSMYQYPSTYLPPPTRFELGGTGRSASNGFRCARTP